MKSFDKMLLCPYCNGNGKLFKYKCKLQNIVLYRCECKNKCPKAVTFASRDRDCAVEMWNAISVNINRLKKK